MEQGTFEGNDYILIGDLKDYNDYCEYSQDLLNDHLGYLVKEINRDRWDHYPPKGHISGIYRMAFVISEMRNINLLECFDIAIHEFKYAIFPVLYHLGDDRVIIINKNGGWGYTDLSKIENIKKYEEEVFQHFYEGNKTLILENDDTLDKWFRENDFTGCSHIVRLKRLMEDPTEFKKVINDFVENGGEKFLIYTTAGDITQLNDYMDVIDWFGLPIDIYLVDTSRVSDINDYVNMKLHDGSNDV